MRLLALAALAWPAPAPAQAEDLRITPEIYCEDFIDYEIGIIAGIEHKELLRRADALRALPADRLGELDVATLCFAARHQPGRLPPIAMALFAQKQDAKGCTALWERLCRTDREAIVNAAVRRVNHSYPPRPTCDRLRDFLRSEVLVWRIRGLPSPLPCFGPYYNLGMALYNLRRLTYADHATDPSLQSFTGRVPSLYDEIVGRSLSIELRGGTAREAATDAGAACHRLLLTPDELGPGAIDLPATLPAIDRSLLVMDWIGARIVREARRTYHPDYPTGCGARAEFLAGRARNPDPGHLDCKRGERACDLALGSWWGGAFSWSVLWWNIVETFPGRLDSNEEIDKARRLHARFRKYHCIQNCFLQIPTLDEIARVLGLRPPAAASAGGFLRVPPSGANVPAFDAPGGTAIWMLHNDFWSHITAVRGDWAEIVVRDPESGEPTRAWVRSAAMELLP